MNEFINVLKKNAKNEKVFRFSYILCLFLSCLCFIEPACLGLTTLNMLWALYFFKERFSNKNIKQICCHTLLLLFLASGVITAFVNKEDHFIDNIIMMYHAAICFILLYGMHSYSTKEERDKETFQLFKILTTLINLFAFAGILILLIFIRVNAFGYTIGLFANRFTGLYTHPNIAAFVSVIGIIGCHLLYNRKNEETGKYYLPKWFCISGVVMHFLTIWLADSNASFVYTCVYFFIYTCIKKDVLIDNKKKNVLKILLITTVFVLCNYGLRVSSQHGMVSLISHLHYNIYSATDTTYLEDGMLETPTIEIGRVEQQDLSSGRLDSFQKAFLLFEVKPLLGVGKANILTYGERYLVNGFRFFDLHNGYLTILVSCGLIGFEFFLFFLIELLRKAYYLVKKISTIQSADQKTLSVFISALIGYGAYAMFERTILFDITFMVIIFWVILGQFMSCALTYEGEKERKKNILTDLSQSLQAVRKFLFRLK